MKIVKLACPHCGANLEIEDGRNKCFCSYCGGQVFIDDEVKRSEHHSTVTIRNEARVRELELQQAEFQRQVDKERKAEERLQLKRRRWKWVLVIALVFLIVRSFTGVEGLSDASIALSVSVGFVVACFYPFREEWGGGRKLLVWFLSFLIVTVVCFSSWIILQGIISKIFRM